MPENLRNWRAVPMEMESVFLGSRKGSLASRNLVMERVLVLLGEEDDGGLLFDALVEKIKGHSNIISLSHIFFSFGLYNSLSK